MKNMILNFVRDEQGQDLIEYTMLLGFIALAAVATAKGLGSALKTVFSNASSSLS